MGIVLDDHIKAIMEHAREPNRQVIMVEVTFDQNQGGQAAAVLAIPAQLGINVLDIDSEVYGSRAVVRLYVPPDAYRQLPKLLGGIWDDQTLREKAFHSIVYRRAGDRHVFFE